MSFFTVLPPAFSLSLSLSRFYFSIIISFFPLIDCFFYFYIVAFVLLIGVNHNFSLVIICFIISLSFIAGEKDGLTVSLN